MEGKKRKYEVSSSDEEEEIKEECKCESHKCKIYYTDTVFEGKLKITTK
jgi:hypothetical protein